jgi:hypothetical protein
MKQVLNVMCVLVALTAAVPAWAQQPPASRCQPQCGCVVRRCEIPESVSSRRRAAVFGVEAGCACLEESGPRRRVVLVWQRGHAPPARQC